MIPKISETSLADNEHLADTIATGFQISEQLPEEKDFPALVDQLQYQSLAQLVVLGEDICTETGKPNATIRNKLDAAELYYKLSGLAAKHTAKEQAAAGGKGYQLVINFSGRPPETFTGQPLQPLEKEVGGEVVPNLGTIVPVLGTADANV